jgi:putative aldouronate transport system permease protein
LRNGFIQEVSDTIDVYVVIYGFRNGNFSMATAAGMFKNIVNVTLIFTANWIAKKAGEERLI